MRGKSGGARTSLPTRGAGGDVSDSVAVALDKGSLGQHDDVATGDSDNLREETKRVRAAAVDFTEKRGGAVSSRPYRQRSGGAAGPSGNVSAETMTVPGGMAHLARRRQAAAACGARTTLSAWGAQTREELRTRGLVGMVRLYGTGAMALPPRAANPGVARGGLAADKRAPYVSDFPFSEILENSFPLKKNRYKVRKNLRKFLKIGN
jgi:hypothetical protein